MLRTGRAEDWHGTNRRSNYSGKYTLSTDYREVNFLNFSPLVLFFSYNRVYIIIIEVSVSLKNGFQCYISFQYFV